ncbi:MAG: hypothetical protein WBF04_15575 [Candidatus Sulfotelmatobacter sp.]
MAASGEQQKRDQENDSHDRVNDATGREAHDPVRKDKARKDEVRKDEVRNRKAPGYEVCNNNGHRPWPYRARNRASENYLAVVPGCFSM